MSLNGLDDVKVKEAYDTAAAEPGGWLLLKYQSRDEVDILDRGSGGILEIRNSIAQYEEESPLFGYLRYRRRNVLIKYVPDGCSRLVQARVHVHFNAVSERFSPFDAELSISSSEELQDTKLSAACSLHTASGSTSSSTSSIRRQRLREIAEDEEEEVRAKRQSTVHEERASQPSTARETSLDDDSHTALSSNPLETTTQKSFVAKNNLETSPPPPLLPHHSSPKAFVAKNDLDTSPPPPRTSTSEPRSRSPTRSIDSRRPSTQSTRPDLYTYNSYGSNGKPKLKLGPRPSVDITGRPSTSGSVGEHRAVSNLPAGLKLLSRQDSKSKDRPRTQYQPNNEMQSINFAPPPIPESSAEEAFTMRPHTSGGRPTTSSGASMKSVKSNFTTAPKKDPMTQEKARLMKALQMRKKQMASPPPSQPLPPLPPPNKSSLELPPSIAQNRMSIAPQDVQDTLAMLKDMTEGEGEDEAPTVSHETQETESDATRTLSTPNSPMDGQSTKASSVSDSTDETVREGVQEEKAAAAEDEDMEIRESEQSTSLEANKEEMIVKAPALVMAAVKSSSILDHKNIAPTSRLSDQPAPGAPPVNVLKSAEPTTVETSEINSGTGIANNNGQQTLTEDVREVPVAKNSLRAQFVEHGIAATKAVPLSDATDSKINMSSVEVPDSPSKKLNIPRSKFSVQDLKVESEVPSAAAAPAQLGEVTGPEERKSSIASTVSDDSSIAHAQNGTKRRGSKRRKGLVEPIRTDMSVTDRSDMNTENEFSDDDDLMDELQSASVQEAKPVSVSKSPIAPMFARFSPKKALNANDDRFSRAFSNPIRKGQGSNSTPNTRPESQGGDGSRSVSASAAYLQRINQQQQIPVLAKKVNIGSSISQRIKALESNLTPDAAASPAPPQNATPAFYSVRKASVRTGSRSPSVADRANSLTRQTPSPSQSRDPSPETFKIRERSGSVASRLTTFNSSPEQITVPKARTESIQVTARIIRDPEQAIPSRPMTGHDPLSIQPLALRESPLTIDHQKPEVAPAQKETIQERRLSGSTTSTVKKDRRSSISVVKDIIDSSRNSFSSRRSMSVEPQHASPGPHSSSRPPSSHTNTVLSPRPSSVQSRRSIGSRENSFTTLSPGHSSDEASLSNKKENRASRMMRRMSSGLSASRKSLAHALSPTVREDVEPDSVSTLAPSTSSGLSATPDATFTIAEVGDVNVQFPDTLLWKRRSVRLDSAGFLVLAPASSSAGAGANGKVSIKRIHLSSFYEPIVPEAEVMEMPNSVVLRFLEGMIDGNSSGYGGGDLQIACEDRGGQLRVLESKFSS